MGFLNPINLLWAGALAVLAIIYLRSRSRPTISVSSLMLFDELPAPVASVRHVRIDPLFWLEVTALSALVLAIGGLYAMMPAKAGRGRSHAMVFDIGAGMSAQTEGTTSLDGAKKHARQIIANAPAGDEFSIITYALEAQVVVPQTQNLSAVRKALDDLQPLAVAAHASAFSAAIMRARGSSEIELFTDRPPPERALNDAKGTPVHVNRSAHGDDNVAIESLDPGTVMVSRGRALLRNFSTKPRLADLRVKTGDRELFHEALILAPREQMVVPLKPLTAGGLVKAEILTPDAIAADNEHWVYAPSDAPGHALVLSPDARVRDDLARVLLAVNPRLQIEAADPAKFDAAKAPHPLDLAVMHDSYVPGISAAATLLIYPPTPVSPAARIPGLAISNSAAPVFLSGDHNDPAGAGQGVMLSKVRSLSLPDWMDMVTLGLVSGSELVPLAAVGRIPGGRIGILAFDVRDRLLLDPDRLDALVVTVNLVKRLTAPGDVQVVSTGSYVDVPVAAASATVTAPDGSATKVAPDKWSRVRIRPLQSGHYSIAAGNKIVDVFANYFDASESDLASVPIAVSSAAASAPAEHPASTGPRQVQPLLLILAALAMVAFAVESGLLIRHAALWGTGHV